MLPKYWLMQKVSFLIAIITNQYKTTLMNINISFREFTFPNNMGLISEFCRDIICASTIRRQAMTRMTAFTLPPSTLKNTYLYLSLFLWCNFHTNSILNNVTLEGTPCQPRLEVIDRLGYPSINNSRGIANGSKQKGYRGNREMLRGGN